MTPFRKLIMALDVAKNGLPSMMGTWLVPSATGSISRTTKSTDELKSHLFLVHFSVLFSVKIE